MNNPVKQVQEQLDLLYREHRDLAYRSVTGSLTPVKDVQIGGTDAAYAAVPLVNALNLAALVLAAN